MNYPAELFIEAKKAIAKYSEHRCEIIDLYQLAMDEIEEGESEANEYALFMDSVTKIKQRA